MEAGFVSENQLAITALIEEKSSTNVRGTADQEKQEDLMVACLEY